MVAEMHFSSPGGLGGPFRLSRPKNRASGLLGARRPAWARARDASRLEAVTSLGPIVPPLLMVVAGKHFTSLLVVV